MNPIEFKNFVFDLEDLGLESKILISTFGACYETITEKADEQAEFVISGLYKSIYTLDERINKLSDQAFYTLQENIKKQGRREKNHDSRYDF